MSSVLMKCGCVALATNKEGKPVCPMHIGIVAGAEQVQDDPPSLAGRFAFCTYCHSKRPSDYSLPFFEVGYYRQGSLFNDADSFYCGCRGWD